MRQVKLPAEPVTRTVGGVTCTYHQDGSREVEGLRYWHPEVSCELVDGVPPAIASTLADNEDEHGRVPRER